MEASPEVLLCDSSYLGVAERVRRRPDRNPMWPQTTIQRIADATLAISVITVAEVRAGWRYARWGEKTITEADQRLRAYLWIPLDMEIVDRWAQLDAGCKSDGGPHVDDNDKWIAATAIEHALVLVTCDQAQSELPGLRDPVLLWPS